MVKGKSSLLLCSSPMFATVLKATSFATVRLAPVPTRYRGEQLESWTVAYNWVGFRSRHNVTHAITLDNLLPPFTPFSGDDYYWSSRLANDCVSGRKYKNTDERADIAQVENLVGEWELYYGVPSVRIIAQSADLGWIYLELDPWDFLQRVKWSEI